MKTALGCSVAFLLFLLVCSSIGYSGSMGNGAAQRAAAYGNATPAPAQNAPAANPQGAQPAAGQNAATIPGLNAPVPAGAIMLNAIPLGAINGTGGGHYQPVPVITNGGGGTLLMVAKGSRVQAYVDGQPGPVVNGIPMTQTLVQPKWGDSTNGSPQFSADQKRVAYIVDLDNNKHAVVVDGTMSPAYDQINWLSFAPVGHHFAYSAQRSSQAQYASFIVDDGKAGKIYSQGCGPAVFSPDGNHVAYVGSVYSKGLTPIEVQEGKKTPQNVCVVLDGVEQKHFAKIEQLTFSADSKHLAYLAGIDQLAATRVVVDNQEGPAYDSVQQLVISDDGSQSACIATKTIKPTPTPDHNNPAYTVHVVVDNGKEGAPYDEQITHVCVSPDGQHVAYVAQGTKTNTEIVEDEKPSQQYRACDTLLFSPDSKTMLYIATGAQGSFIVVNGQEYGPFSGMFTPAFSQEGGHWACGVTTVAGGFAIIEDGKTIAVKGAAPETLAFEPGTNQLMMKAPNSHDGIAIMFEVKGDVASVADVPTDIVYSPNHQHVAKVFTAGFQTSEQKQKIAIDDQPAAAAEYPDIRNLAISDDGKHVAFIGAHIGEDGKSLTHAVYDGTEGPGYWGIKDIALSPDGLHVAYVAEKSTGSAIDTYVVIDGVEGPAFQDVLIDGAYSGQGMGANGRYHQVRFAPDGSLSFLPVVNGQLYRCSYPAEAFKGLPSMAVHEAEKPGPRELHNFKRAEIFEDQAEAMGFVLAPDGTIYGVSDADGKFKHGTLFKLKTDGSGFAVLHDFYGGDDDGQSPTSLVLLPDGSLFGMAEKGFRYDPKAQQFALVTVDPKDHVNMLAGCAPDGTIIGFGGGSIMDKANVVSMAADGSNYASFVNSQFGKPLLMYSQIVAGKDGTFFAIGMVQNKASIVKFKSLKDTPTLVHKFAALPTDGNRPDANLTMDSKGNLYGSTSAGGMSQNGVIYKVNADGSNYQVVYNPDQFAFSKVFVAGDDGMLYGISKEGLAQLVPDGSGKPPTTLVAFDGSNYTNNRGMTNIMFHDGAVYGMHGAAIYKVTLPQAGAVAGTGGAAPTVAIKTIQPQPLASEAITITDPAGAASAGSAALSTPADTMAAPQSGQAVQSASPAATQPAPDAVIQKVNKVKKNKAGTVDKAIKGLGGLLGH